MFSSVYVYALYACLVSQMPGKEVKSLGASVVDSCKVLYFRPLVSDVVVCVSVEHWGEVSLKESHWKHNTLKFEELMRISKPQFL